MIGSIIFAASRDMASRTQFILILACACLVDCRLRGKFNKQSISPTEHKNIQEVNKITNVEPQLIAEIKTNRDVVPEAKTIVDEDAIVFPKDEDIKVYLDVSKIFKEATNTMDTNKHNNATSATYVPSLPKVVPAVEAKEAFTNKVVLKDKNVAYKTKEDIENIQTKPIQEIADANVASDAVTEENSNITVDNNVTTIISNDTSRSNETVPDFLSRFGATGNYVLVPANNVQTYQAVQVPNVPVQDNVQQYGTYSGQGNTNTPLNTNTGAYTQYASNANIPNVANPQYSQNKNVLLNEPYATPNAPVPYNGITQGTYNVPISVGNTYMINGQLYATVTVPNNVNVPSSVYLINTQLPQGNNNLPLYKLVSVEQGDQGNVISIVQ